MKAFLLGGVAWFGIPLGIATSMGLAAVALAHGDNPLIHLSTAEVGAGLPAVKGECWGRIPKGGAAMALRVSLISACAALMGQSGACAILILLFLAVTSACSAEQIAVSSLLTYDVYGTYINKQPTEKQILRTSQLCIVCYAVFMGGIATAFNYIGVSMGYLYELMGTMIGSAVVPIALCITWRKANGTGAVVGAIAGFCAGVAGWIGITSSLNDGVINVETTFGDYEMLTGNLLAIGIGGIVTVGWSLIRPANFDWDITRAINNVHATTVEERDGMTTPPSAEKDEKNVPGSSPILDGPAAEVQPSDITFENEGLKKAFRLAARCAIALTIVLLIVIPLPLFFSSHGESIKKVRTEWVADSSLPASWLHRLGVRQHHLALCWLLLGWALPHVGGKAGDHGCLQERSIGFEGQGQ